MLHKTHFIFYNLEASVGDMEDGALPEATSDRDATGCPMQLMRRHCPCEDGGPVKMEAPRLKLPHHDNGGSLKLLTTLKTYCGSAAEMNGI